MKRKYIILGSVAVLAILSFISLSLINNNKKITSDVTLVSYNKNQLVNDATTIVSGTVISSEVQNDFQNLPATDYKIKVNEVFKGDPDKEIEVRTAGGKNEDMNFVPDEEMVSFIIGEEVILFLTNDLGDRPDRNDFQYFVVGQTQGKFDLVNGKIENSKFSFDKNNFMNELKNIENKNKLNNIKPIKAKPESKEI